MRTLGSIYTPQDFASYLTSWAIQKRSDKVLDMGIGEGVFVFTAYQRLLDLGASNHAAQNQIYGAEIEKTVYDKFLRSSRTLGVQFPNLQNEDFFQLPLPTLDAIVGNPPYVRRKHIQNVNQVRESVLGINSKIDKRQLLRLTDLYIYFLLRALPALEIGGRLATIVADSWLNVRYGRAFKEYLKENFQIKQLVSLDRRVFGDVQVKPVLLLATRKEIVNPKHTVQFVRVKNGLPIRVLQDLDNDYSDDVVIADIQTRELGAKAPWGIYFKAPSVYKQLAKHELMAPVSELADTYIGIQTLAKEFFILTAEQVQEHGIESEFLAPVVQSTRYHSEPLIDENTSKFFYVFYCSLSKEELRGTQALKYILRGESTEVNVRGKNLKVLGYHNKERIKKANRQFWYDLKTGIESRGRGSILIPRLIYHSFTVVWNKAKFVPGELFIEFIPKNPELVLEVYLAVLNSSISEIMLRLHAQVYGGGTYNLNPGQIKSVPILDVEKLTTEQRNQLVDGYRRYMSKPDENRAFLDSIVCQILRYDGNMLHKITETLEDLRSIATSAKKSTDP